MAQVIANYAEKLAAAQMPAGKKKVLLTSLKLFANNGFHATTTAKIAQQAGVSEGNIYKYFSSKEDLLTHLLQPILEDIKANFFHHFHQYNDLAALVNFIVTDRIQFIETNFAFIQVIFQEVLTGHLRDNPAYRKFFTGQTGVLSKVQDLQLRFEEINQTLTPAQLVRIFVGPILSYVLQKKLLHFPVNDNDQKLIRKQIIANLTQK